MRFSGNRSFITSLAVVVVLSLACDKAGKKQPPATNDSAALPAQSTDNRTNSAKEAMGMKEPLKQLLDELEKVGETHDELYDTDVREHMSNAIWAGFVNPKSGWVMPDELGMFSPDGNAAVKAALLKYIEAAVSQAEKLGLTTEAARRDAFQDGSVESYDEQAYDDFFGHRNG